MSLYALSRRFTRGAFLVAALSSLAGCAPMVSGAMNLTTTHEDVRQKTAKYFGVQIADLEISNIEKQALSTDYQVRYKGKFYNCTIYYGEVSCKQPGA